MKRIFPPFESLIAGVAQSGTALFSVNGGRPQDNNYTLDGVDSNMQMMNSPGISPPMDAIQEFKVATNTGTGEFGRFSVKKSQGLIAGRYRVEVRQDATRWLSNLRDPMMIKMMGKQRSNTLTDEDRIDVPTKHRRFQWPD